VFEDEGPRVKRRNGSQKATLKPEKHPGTKDWEESAPGVDHMHVSDFLVT
jgi:hypothetical protein